MATFNYLLIVRASVLLSLYLLMSPSKLTLLQPLHRRFGIWRGWVPIIFNQKSHSPVTGWSTMSALAWVTQRSAVCTIDSAFSSYFFLLSLSLLPSETYLQSLSKFKSSYHVRVDFAIPADYRVKIKESEKIHKYLDLARELKKQWKMRVKIKLIIVNALGTVSKSLEKGLEKLEISRTIETIQSTALLRSAWILKELWRSQETCCHSDSSERPPADPSVKKLAKSNNYYHLFAHSCFQIFLSNTNNLHTIIWFHVF